MNPKPLNQCGACGEDFNGVRLFDRHRVGVHAYTITEGLNMEPPHEDGRRCLDTDEMQERGWAKNDRGRWIDPEEAAKARKAFPRIAEQHLRGDQAA